MYGLMVLTFAGIITVPLYPYLLIILSNDSEGANQQMRGGTLSLRFRDVSPPTNIVAYYIR